MAGVFKLVKSTQPDDVEALCSIAEINPSGYKRFGGTMKITPASGVSPPQPEPPPAPILEDSAAAAGLEQLSSAVSTPSQRPTANCRFQPIPVPALRVDPPAPAAIEETPRISGNYRSTSRVALKRIFEQNLKNSSHTFQPKRVRQ